MLNLLFRARGGQARPDHHILQRQLGGGAAVSALQVDTTLHKLRSYRWLQSQACEFVWKKKTKEGCRRKCYFNNTVVHSARFQYN